MEATMTFAEAESEFVSLLDSKPLQVNDLLSIIHSVPVKNNKKDEEWANIVAQELIDAGDFQGLYLVIKSLSDYFLKTLGADGIVHDFKRACKDRLILAFIDTVPFKSQPLHQSFRQLDTLLELSPGTQVIDNTWGFGTVKRLDNFYKRVTIDFSGKRGHNLTFKTASESLIRAPHDHILTVRANNPDEIKRLRKENPDELIKMAITSFGKMPVPKLEAALIEKEIIQPSQWKSFWDNARKKLRKDPLVVVPSKRTECIEILAQATSYDEKWFENLKNETDPKAILDAVSELDGLKKLKSPGDSHKAIINDRLGFALRGADNTNPALYVRLIILCRRHGFEPDVFDPSTQGKQLENPHTHLWGRNRFIRAAENLTVRDVANMVEFLLSEGEQAIPKLLGALPLMPFNLLNETLLKLKDKPEAAAACRQILVATKAPPPLVNWVFRYRKQIADWDLPPLMELLHHAIITVETNLTGEDLRMQNSLKKLFSSPKWLEEIFSELNESHRQLVFERIQASPAWDPSRHRALIARMLKLDPSLADRKRLSSDDRPQIQCLTSWRSLAEKQLQYKQLVEVEMPKNSNDIAVARSYGDLRENFEYQAAKDYQRQLLQKQAEMQLELEIVKGTDFAGVSNETAAPGTTVTIRLEDGSEKQFTILGEWDSDEKLNIISNKTSMAESLIGKKTGDSAIVPAAGDGVRAEVTAITPLSDNIKAWIAENPQTTE